MKMMRAEVCFALVISSSASRTTSGCASAGSPAETDAMFDFLAEKYGIVDGDWATAESRRGTITLRAQVVTTIRPDTIFIPYHWPGRKAANQLTIAAQDPVSNIPEFKVCAVRIRKADGPSVN